MPENNENQNNQRRSQIPPYPPQYNRRRRNSNWWIPVVIILAVIVVIGFLIFAFFGMVGSAFQEKKVEVTSNSVLYLDLNNVQEYKKANPFQAFTGEGKSQGLMSIISSLERAAEDKNIKGVYIKPGLNSPGFVKSANIMSAIEKFKESGKFVYAFMEVGMESQYYNALPADSIFMPNEGILQLDGFMIVSMFYKNLLNKAGVNFYVERFEDFKSAADSYSKTGFSDSARYQLEIILDHRFNQFIEKTAKFRNIDKATIEDVLREGIYSADTLKQLGFIDAFKTETDVKEFIEEVILGDNQNDMKVNYVKPNDYLKSDPPLNKEIYDSDTQIAIIYGTGAISSGKSDEFGSDYSIKSGSYAKYLKEAREDDKIKAIILRIDSPGGSVIASEEIWQEIMKTKKIKPVYASMSDVAASGGYYMAMACDTIIANPSTITGSIGVIAAVPNLSELRQKIYVDVDTITTNKSANFMNALMPFSDSEKQKFHKMVSDMYKRFVSKVAESRGMEYEETRKLAKGRVWLGKDAKEKGLVDILGDLGVAVQLAKKRIGVPEDNLVLVQSFPKPVDEVEALLKLFGLDASVEADQKPIVNLAEKLGMDPVQMIQTWNSLPPEVKQDLEYMKQIMEISHREKYMMAMPELIHIK